MWLFGVVKRRNAKIQLNSSNIKPAKPKELLGYMGCEYDHRYHIILVLVVFTPYIRCSQEISQHGKLISLLYSDPSN